MSECKQIQELREEYRLDLFPLFESFFRHCRKGEVGDRGREIALMAEFRRRH